MAIDRLAELRRNAGAAGSSWNDHDSDPPLIREKSSSQEDASNGSNLDMNQLLRRYDGIKGGLEILTGATAQINTLRQKYKETTKEKQRRDIIRQMEECMNKATNAAGKIKQTLDEIRKDNVAWESSHSSQLHTAAHQARDNLLQTHIRRYSHLMTEYHSAATSFKQSVLDRTKRDIKNVDATLSDDVIDKIVDSGQADVFVSESMMRDNSQIDDTVRLIEQRHTDILELERSVREVFELFKDLATLVDLQQESLDVIENRIDRARAHVEVGAVNIQEASEYQNKARRRRCCLLFLLLGILGVILGPVIAKSVKKS